MLVRDRVNAKADMIQIISKIIENSTLYPHDSKRSPRERYICKTKNVGNSQPLGQRGVICPIYTASDLSSSVWEKERTNSVTVLTK